MFVVFVDSQTVKTIRTRLLLGQSQIIMEHTPLMITASNAPLTGEPVTLEAYIDDTHILSVDVPISEDVMSWVTPTVENMCVVYKVRTINGSISSSR